MNQNRALFILAFVTILMLPLQALTSYWGMNLIDIRDTGWNQSEFWKFCGMASMVVLGGMLVLVLLWKAFRTSSARFRFEEWKKSKMMAAKKLEFETKQIRKVASA